MKGIRRGVLVIGAVMVLILGWKILSRSGNPGISIYSNDAFNQLVLSEIDLKRVDLQSGVSALVSRADEQVIKPSDPSETISIQLDPSLTKERLWFLRWLPERSISLKRKGQTLTQILDEFTNGFGKTYVKLGRHAIIVPNDPKFVEKAKAELCRRALEEITLPDLAIDDLPVRAVLQQLEALSEKGDRYGKGVRINMDASITEPQLAKRMTTELFGRSFDSQFGWACNLAELVFEWGGYEDDCLLVDVRSGVVADGTSPTPFQLGEGHPVELVIHDGDDFKGVYIDIPSESESGVSVWVDDQQVATALKPGSVTSTLTGKKIVLRQDGNGSCFGRYRFYAWIVKASA